MPTFALTLTQKSSSAPIFLHLSTSDIASVTTSNGVTIVGSALEFVVEGGDPGEEVAKSCAWV